MKFEDRVPFEARKTLNDGVKPNPDGAKSSTSPPAPYDRMMVIAHRGFADQNPQNTMLAWANALQYGNADALETDVSVSSDDVLYCFHDATVDALTDGTGDFTSLSSSTIDGLSFTSTVGTIYADLKIPLFSEFLNYARRMGVYVYPEIKGIRTPADIDLIVQAVVDADMETLCTLSSFYFSELSYARSKNSTIGVMFQTSNLEAAEGDINYLSGTIGGKTAILIDPSPMFGDPDRARFLISHAKAKNVEFVCSTAVSQTTAEFMGALGVTKIFSNI